MNSYQSMLTIGSIMLMSLASIRFNSSVLQNITVETENKVALTAFSLADDMIEIIKQKAFDAHTVDFPTTDPNSLTHPNSLGPANGETFDNFNDIDDYNNFTKYVSAPHAEDYYVSCKVHYVNADNPDQISTVQTFYKRVSITVTSPFLKNPVKLSTIFTLK